VLYIVPTTSKRDRALFSFDFSANVPVGATITAATLSLYFFGVTAGRTLTAYRLLRIDWNQGQATWNVFKTSNNWGTPGALNAATDITTTDAATAASLAAAGWVSWDVKEQVQTARNFVGGIACFLVADAGASAAVSQACWSREGSVALCPKLYIEYTVPGLTGASFLLRMI
jgi:hypothetical protein